MARTPKTEQEIEQPRPPLPKIEASPIPQVAKRDPESITNPAQPFDHEYTDGLFVKNSGASEGEQFALCIWNEDAYGNTHFCKNSEHFWSGKADEFKLQFDRA